MKKLSNNKFVNILINLLFLMLFAKLFAVALLWFLPTQTEELQESSTKTMPYRRVDFHNFLEAKTKQKRVKTEYKEHKQRSSIKDMILHGLYGNSKEGYAIVATKSAPNKTEIISIGEKYHGYTLKRIALNFVVFVRNNKEYILNLDNTIDKNKMNQVVTSVVQSQEEASPISVSRSELHSYINNPSQIWRDIAINEIKKDGKIIGFKVTKVTKGSKMAALGLQRGDIILKANGVALTSYNAAFKFYKNINKLETLSLLIKRGNEEKELIYEIN